MTFPIRKSARKLTGIVKITIPEVFPEMKPLGNVIIFPVLYTRQSLHNTTQLLQGLCEVRAKIWSNYTPDKVYILQHSYSKAPVELEPKFGQIAHKTKPTYYNTATPRLM